MPKKVSASQPPQPTEVDKQVAESLLRESDRGCAIFGAEVLNDALENLLRLAFRRDPAAIRHAIDPLFSGYAPLSTMSARIDLSFALGLITPELRRRLGIVRRLRNTFAHASGPIAFDDPTCRDRLAELIGGKVEEHSDDALEVIFGRQQLSRGEAVTRIVFIMAITRIHSRIDFIASSIKEGKDGRVVAARLEQGGM